MMSAAPAPLTPVRAPATPAAVPKPPLYARLVEQVSSYLPLLLMALLALGTWWLVKNTPAPDTDRPAAPLRHEPDYTMTNFIVRRFAPDGAMRAQIEGDTLRHYPDTDTTEIDNVRIRMIGSDGQVTRAEARLAVANADGSEVQLQGGAHVVRESLHGEDPVDFRGEFLHAFLDTERVRSHLPVVVTQGGTQVHGDAMDYDNLERIVQVHGRVTAVFPASGSRR
jgi:lipopolysaccharide export system protein LptC